MISCLLARFLHRTQLFQDYLSSFEAMWIQSRQAQQQAGQAPSAQQSQFPQLQRQTVAQQQHMPSQQQPAVFPNHSQAPLQAPTPSAMNQGSPTPSQIPPTPTLSMRADSPGAASESSKAGRSRGGSVSKGKGKEDPAEEKKPKKRGRKPKNHHLEGELAS